MPVPEAAMNKNDGAIAREYEIGLAGKRPVMQAVSKPERVDGTPENQLRPRITTPDCAHVPGALSG